MLLVMAAVPLIGAVMPEQIPERIQARGFDVIDENGTTRAVMDVAGFGYWDENGPDLADNMETFVKVSAWTGKTAIPE